MSAEEPVRHTDHSDAADAMMLALATIPEGPNRNGDTIAPGAFGNESNRWARMAMERQVELGHLVGHVIRADGTVLPNVGDIICDGRFRVSNVIHDAVYLDRVTPSGEVMETLPMESVLPSYQEDRAQDEADMGARDIVTNSDFAINAPPVDIERMTRVMTEALENFGAQAGMAVTEVANGINRAFQTMAERLRNDPRFEETVEELAKAIGELDPETGEKVVLLKDRKRKRALEL